MSDFWDGNEAQSRKVARSLFDVWREEQESEAKNAKLGGVVPAWFAVVLSVGTLVWGAAVLSADVKDTKRRVDQIEIGDRQQEIVNREIVERMARIEAKLDIVVETRQ